METLDPPSPLQAIRPSPSPLPSDPLTGALEPGLPPDRAPRRGHAAGLRLRAAAVRRPPGQTGTRRTKDPGLASHVAISGHGGLRLSTRSHTFPSNF